MQLKQFGERISSEGGNMQAQFLKTSTKQQRVASYFCHQRATRGSHRILESDKEHRCAEPHLESPIRRSLFVSSSQDDSRSSPPWSPFKEFGARLTSDHLHELHQEKLIQPLWEGRKASFKALSATIPLVFSPSSRKRGAVKGMLSQESFGSSWSSLSARHGDEGSSEIIIFEGSRELSLSV